MKLDVKPVEKTETKSPFVVKPGQNAILLVPTEEGPREQLTDLFYEQDLMATDEEDRKAKGLPLIRDKINLKRLREEDVVFTAVVVPKKYGPRKQISEWGLKISKPVAVKGLIPNLSDIAGEDVEPDFTAVVDAIQAGCHPFSCKVSQDKILTIRSL